MATTRANDRFQKMLMWSFALHFVLFTAMALAARLQPGAPLPRDSTMFIIPGAPGPGSGGGSMSPSRTPDSESEPEPPPDAPKPEVVRPTKETRDLLPDPEAKPPRKTTPKKAPDSLVRGPDAASKESAPLQQPSGPSGVPGLGLGGSGGGSAFDQDFEYAYYWQQMYNRIGQNWQRTPVRGMALTVIQFTIMKDGSVHDVRVEESSRVRTLDRGALRAVMLSDPLPPLPNSFPGDRVGVHVTFTYSDR